VNSTFLPLFQLRISMLLDLKKLFPGFRSHSTSMKTSFYFLFSPKVPSPPLRNRTLVCPPTRYCSTPLSISNPWNVDDLCLSFCSGPFYHLPQFLPPIPRAPREVGPFRFPPFGLPIRQPLPRPQQVLTLNYNAQTSPPVIHFP